MPKITKYNLLAFVSLILTPLAIVSSLGYEGWVYINAQTNNPLWIVVVTFTWVFTGAGVEAVGIKAGLTFERLLQKQENGKAAAVFTMLLLYGYVLYNLLVDTPLKYLPVITVLLYLVNGFYDSVHKDEEAQNKQEERVAAHEETLHEIEVQRLKLELEKEKQLAALEVEAKRNRSELTDKLRIMREKKKMGILTESSGNPESSKKNEIQLSSVEESSGKVPETKIQLSSVEESSPEIPESSGKQLSTKRESSESSESLRKVREKSWQKLSEAEKVALSKLSKEEREKFFPEMTPKSIRNWHNRLDGVYTENR